MKLTNAIRDAIVKAVLVDTFSAREDALAAKETEVGDRIYNYFFEQHESDMFKFPEGFFPEQTEAVFKIGDSWNHCRVKMSQRRRVSHRAYHGVFGVFDNKHPIATAYHAYTSMCAALKKERNEVEQATRQLVYSATTDKKLLELWPEGERFIPKEPVVTANLPAVTAVNLNNLIAQYKKAA